MLLRDDLYWGVVMSDLISRQNAIDALKKYEELESNNFTDTSPISMMTVATIANCIEEIVNLPSAEPERKKGEWIKRPEFCGDDVSGFVDNHFSCSECKKEAEINSWGFYILSDFCPNCGADMRTSDESAASDQ